MHHPQTIWSWRKLLSSFLLILIMLASVIQGSHTTQAQHLSQPPASLANGRDRESEDPSNRMYAAQLAQGKASNITASDLPPAAVSHAPFSRKPVDTSTAPRPHEKMHPKVQQWVTTGDPNTRVRVMVNFSDPTRIPRFPEPEVDEPRDSPTNKALLARAGELVKGIQHARASEQARLATDLEQRHQAKVRDRFWLVNAMSVELPLAAVRGLAQRADVLYVEPEQTDEAPPSAYDVAAGRSRIMSDPYFNLGQTGGWIGLLDTGIRATHTQFNNPSHISIRRDCVNGTADNCATGSALNPDDDCWNHGTASAAIITANGNQGNAYRGVTAITLDSFKVYPSGCGGLNTAAAVRGFQAAVAVLDRVIVAEMQGTGSETSSISVAADQAFDAGAVVIAANGNNGPNASTVNVPANAHKVLGVGDFDVQTLAQIDSQSRGPTGDGRIKPDIQTPTNTETASNSSSTALRIFGGTSGATPYAAGAGALLRNWLRGTNFNIDPGQVYAHMILSGQQVYPFNNTSGAGRLILPTDGHAWWGKVTVTNGATIDIPIDIGSARSSLDGALWWPETAAQQHNDIDIYLVDPSGVQRSSSLSVPSVFERTRVTGGLSGTWKIRIRGYSVPTGSQTVYYAAHTK